MELHSYPDDNAVARAAAAMVAVAARSAVAARGRFVAAFSGGQSAAVDCRMGRATAKFPAVKV